MGKSLPGMAAPGWSVVFCRLNPYRRAAAAKHHFVGRGNRFWRVLHLAGDRSLLTYGHDVTTVVDRATAGADELARQELVAATAGLRRWVRRHAPRCIAFLGKAAHAGLTGRQVLDWGCQDEPFGGAVAWLLPNPSGRNRAFSLDPLTTAFRDLRLFAEAGSVAAHRSGEAEV